MIYHIDDYRFTLIGQAAEDALNRAIADRYHCTVHASNFADGFVIHDYAELEALVALLDGPRPIVDCTR